MIGIKYLSEAQREKIYEKTRAMSVISIPRVPRMHTAAQVKAHSEMDLRQSSVVMSVTNFNEQYNKDKDAVCVAVGLWKGVVQNQTTSCLQILAKGKGEREIHAKLLYATTGIHSAFNTGGEDMNKFPCYVVFEDKTMSNSGNKFWKVCYQEVEEEDRSLWRQHWALQEPTITYPGESNKVFRLYIMYVYVYVYRFMLYVLILSLCTQDNIEQSIAAAPQKRKHSSTLTAHSALAGDPFKRSPESSTSSKHRRITLEQDDNDYDNTLSEGELFMDEKETPSYAYGLKKKRDPKLPTV
jgi:hypothetical protein